MRIAYIEDGKIILVTPADTVEKALAAVPENTPYWLIEDDQIPTDRMTRKFWQLGGDETSIEIGAGGIEERKKKLVKKLWKAANDYQAERITPLGAATLLEYRKTKNKAKDILDWIDSVWNLYYTRKDAITDETTEVNTDFSELGELPYSYREARQEIGE